MEALLVATRKGLFTYRGEDAAWSIAARDFLGDPVNLAVRDPRSGRDYAALDLGHFGAKLFRRDPGGHWDEVGVPVYPEAPEEPEIGGDGRPVPYELKKIWALVPGASDQPGRLWCGTIPGGLFVSDDHGDTWDLVEGLWNHPERRRWFGGGADWPGIHSICVDPRDPRTVRVAVSCGGVWISEDDGGEWRTNCTGMKATYVPPDQAEDAAVQDPHCLVQCPGEPDKLWVQHHCGIFRSVDSGATWEAVEGVAPSAFGFPVAVHPERGDTAWFVPAGKDEYRIPVDGAVVVNRTDDGGRTFTTSGKGLPGSDAYDLCYRHALDVAGDGEHLAFGSTTGSLWLSADGGGSWSALNEHLPPIYAVRFA